MQSYLVQFYGERGGGALEGARARSGGHPVGPGLRQFLSDPSFEGIRAYRITHSNLANIREFTSRNFVFYVFFFTYLICSFIKCNIQRINLSQNINEKLA